MDTPEQRLARHLQGTILAFFLLAVLFLVVVSVAAPSIYANLLLLTFSPAEHYPAAATLLLVGVGGGLALVMVGVLRRWRWVFWLVLAAFGGMILDIPATILQLMGILPGLFPVWYSLCRMGASLIAVGIAVWMLHIYRYHGVWAMGRKTHSMRTPVMTRYPTQKRPIDASQEGGNARDPADPARRGYGSLTSHSGDAADGEELPSGTGSPESGEAFDRHPGAL